MSCTSPCQLPNKSSTGLLMPGHKTVSCGSCKACRIAAARSVAVRCEHEVRLMAMHNRPSCFVTLTYRPDSLPDNGFLYRPHLSGFLKRLRRRISDQDNAFYANGFGSHIPKEDRLFLRVYGCGEYGEKLKRPHYHLILFGYVPPDLVFHKLTKRGDKLFKSSFLSDVWGHGFVSVGEANFKSAGYVARYCLKKITGDMSHDHYFSHVDSDTGERVVFPKEFALYPHGKGLGRDFYDLFKSDMFPSGSVFCSNGKTYPTPKYYNELYRKESPESYEAMRLARLKIMAATRDNRTERRLSDAEVILDSRINLLKRDFDQFGDIV